MFVVGVAENLDFAAIEWASNFATMLDKRTKSSFLSIQSQPFLKLKYNKYTFCKEYLLEGHGCGMMVSILAFYSDDPSSNPAAF